MGTFIYNLLQIIQWEWFPYVLFAWLSIAVIGEAFNKWRFLGSLAQVVRQPTIFVHCDEIFNGRTDSLNTSSKDYFFYPRQFLEQTACATKKFFTWPIYKVVLPTYKSIAQSTYSFRQATAQETFLSVFFAIVLTLFAYGDSIAIANGLDALGLIRGKVPTLLLYYELSVGTASFLAIVVGFFMFFESFKHESETVPSGEGAKKRFVRSVSSFIILIGIAVSVLLGIGRITALGYWENNETLALIVQFGINVLTIVNGILAAALVLDEGIKGYRVMLALLLWGIALLLLALDLVLFISARVFWLAIDVTWRILYVSTGIVLFIMFGPIITMIRFLASLLP